MVCAVFPKERLDEILENLMDRYRLAAPVRENGNLIFKEVRNIPDMILNDEIPYKSPKEFLFPQVEELMTFDENGVLSAGCAPAPTVIFGVKPCDLAALKVMTAVFTKGKYEDPYYKQHLEHTILVGMGCQLEKTGCFCRERGIDRHYSIDCDIFLKDKGECYHADVLTDHGKGLMEYLALRVPEIRSENAAAWADAGTVAKNEEKGIDGGNGVSGDMPEDPAVKAPHGLLEINADENVLFSKIDWERISERCLGCGICTFICPTCHCFEFRDTECDGKASRYRCWDSCMYPKFTLHASGHNPRTAKKERYRQRILHKYLYVRQNFGYTACTGCGRCIRSCPAGMNIKSVVSGIMEEIK